MRKFVITRSEMDTFTIEIFAETHEQAEQIAKTVDPENKRWENKGFCVDYVTQCLEDDEDDDD